MPLFTIPNEGSVPLSEENWIARAIKRPGQLHRDLGVPLGKTIPKEAVVAAAKRKGKVGQRARLALTLARFRRPKKTQEANDCHLPAGRPDGGQFCSKTDGEDGRLTLAEWEKQHKYRVQRHPSGAISVPDAGDPAHLRKLSRLADYRVSSFTGGSFWLVPRKAEGKTQRQLSQEGSPRQLKVIPSHAGFSRYLASIKPAGWIARTSVPSPYASGPTHRVYQDPRRGKVFLSEISHRRYAVFEVPKGMRIFTTDEAATKEYLRQRRGGG